MPLTVNARPMRNVGLFKMFPIYGITLSLVDIHGYCLVL